MTLSNVAEPVPLKTDPQGTVRVGGTRVTLDSVVYAFRQGATAEEIQQQYTSLNLADIYSVISYYLRHMDEVDAYITEQEGLSDEFRKECEARFDQTGLRARLVARLKASNNQ